jgi:ferric-dicitrate binding protein FerR (iron transport regulator)
MAGGAAGGRKGIVALALLVLVLVAAFVIRRRMASDTIATLLDRSGAVDRDFKSGVGKWQAAEPSARFTVGGGVRTSKASTATLELADDSKLRLESSTVIRFLDRPSSKKHAQHFDLEMGEANLETGNAAVDLETDIGAAVIGASTHITLTKSDEGTRYEVSVGTARFEGQDGKSVELGAGQGLVIGIGAAQLERYEVKKPEAPAPSAAPSAAPAPPPVDSAAPATGDVGAHITGGGASARAPGATKFSHLNAGDTTLATGTTLRLSSGTTADVSRGGQRATLRGAGEFTVAESGKPFIVAEGGGVSLTGSEAEVQVAVPGGSIVAKLGTRAEVGVQKDATHVSVTAGSLKLTTSAGEEELAAGEEATVGAKGATDVVGRGPGYVDFVVAPGASFAVHDPSPPTAVGFSVGGSCPEGAVVELAGQKSSRARGTGIVSLLFPPGARRYSIHCITNAGIASDVAASGSIAVLHDGGTARIPRTAPATLVDADGRNYTVLYQNLLPKLTVRWPNAPASGPFNVTLVAPGGKSSTFASAGASYTFPAGVLKEGVHRVTFDGGGTRSRETHFDIRFDNAAPTATLTSPQNGSFSPGSTVTVAGVSLEGFKISVGGTNLPLDDQLRFSGEAVVPAGQRALAVEFIHPSRGVQYYLRKSPGH